MTRYFIVDVFTERPFDGAQIAVFPDASGLNAQQMQLLARELNLSDSVFVQALDGASNRFQLRHFSPVKERQFTGQGIIGAAHVLGAQNFIALTQPHTHIEFLQQGGEARVVLSGSKEKLFVQFSRKAQTLVDRYVPANKELAAALSLSETDIASRRYQPMLVSCEQPYLIVPLRSFTAVREAVFNHKEWSTRVAPVSAANEILLFSVKSDISASNFHGRLVGPGIGNEDDPPIGAAIPAFTGYLANFDHVRDGTYAFVIDRGVRARRKSVLSIEMIKQTGKENEIRVGGPAVIVASGEMQPPPSC